MQYTRRFPLCHVWLIWVAALWLQACGLAPEDMGMGEPGDTSSSLGVSRTAMQSGSVEHVFCLRTDDGKHFVNSLQSNQSVQAQRTSCDGDARHVLVDVNGGDLQHGDVVYVRTHYKKYWSAQSDGRMEANRDWMQAWEKFTIAAKNNSTQPLKHGDVVGFRSAEHGKWMVAEQGGGQVVNVNRPQFYGWESFTLYLPNDLLLQDPKAKFVKNSMASEFVQKQLSPLRAAEASARQAWDMAKQKLNQTIHAAKMRFGVYCIEEQVKQCQQRTHCHNVCPSVRVCVFGRCWNVQQACKSVCNTFNECNFRAVWNCSIVPELQRAERNARQEYENKKKQLEDKAKELRDAAERHYEEARKRVEEGVKKGMEALNKLKDLGEQQRKALEQKLKELVDSMAHTVVKDAHRKIHSGMRASVLGAIALAKGKLQDALRKIKDVAKHHNANKSLPLKQRKALWQFLQGEHAKRNASLLQRIKHLKNGGKAVSKAATKAAAGSVALVLIEAGVSMGASYAWAAIECQNHTQSLQDFENCYAPAFAKAAKYALFDAMVALAYAPLELGVVTPKAVALATAVTAIAAASMGPVGAAVAGVLAGLLSKVAVSVAVYQIAEQFFPQYENGMWKQHEAFFLQEGRRAARDLY